MSSVASSAPGAPERIIALIRGESDSPLQGLISGSIDLDKLDYLRRDAFMCGVSYGEIDVDRLINALIIVIDPASGEPRVGMIEKGLSALESLLFASYQMYRNVYWHHAVRSATAMYKRLVADALDAGALDARPLPALPTREFSMSSASEPRAPCSRAAQRKLYKRAFECPAGAPRVGRRRVDRRRPRADRHRGECAGRGAGTRAGRPSARLPDEDPDARPRSPRARPLRRGASPHRRRLGRRGQSPQALRRVLPLRRAGSASTRHHVWHSIRRE